MTYKEYVTQFKGRKGDLTACDDGNTTLIIGGPADIDVLTDVHDDFAVFKGRHEHAVPLSKLYCNYLHFVKHNEAMEFAFERPLGLMTPA